MRISGASLEMNASAAFERAQQVREQQRVALTPRPNTTPRAAPAADPGVEEIADARLLIAKWLYEFLTGHEWPASDLGNFQTKLREAAAGVLERFRSVVAQTRGWSLTYHRQEVVTESESVVFRAAGAVETSDGRHIDFSLDLTMASELTHVQSLTLRAGDPSMTDPLVLRFKPGEAPLSDQRMEFDLDADGDPEHLARLAPGSAFLVLDRDANGIVTNGAELFGPGTGDGFAELAAYDADGNGWIDENDPVFSSLSVWENSDAEEDALIPLREAGVGAIALSRLSTPFSLYSSAGELSGQVAATGVFLTEAGEARALQHIDLAG
ncbi:MAG: hypothetical protein GY953_40300 [bacterium]|nr:hypothetical protein [bacterium]